VIEDAAATHLSEPHDGTDWHRKSYLFLLSVKGPQGSLIWLRMHYAEMQSENAESRGIFSLSVVLSLPLEKCGMNLGLEHFFGQVITVPISATGAQGEQPLDDKIM
jgi:hypothetical protein